MSTLLWWALGVVSGMLVMMQCDLWVSRRRARRRLLEALDWSEQLSRHPAAQPRPPRPPLEDDPTRWPPPMGGVL